MPDEIQKTGTATLYIHGGRFTSAPGATLRAGVKTRIVQRGVMTPPKIAVSEETDPSRIECVFPKGSGLWLCGVGEPASVRFESDCGKTFLIEKVFPTKPLDGRYDIAMSLSGDPAWAVDD